jgi:radical SAM superfamily enzyme YgiQ (UPF0313 family)
MREEKKTVCLITPPSPFLLDERVFMHIGILKVAAVLEQHGHVVDFLDLSGIDNYVQVVEDYCKAHPETTTYGLTASTPQVPFAVQLAEAIRTQNPQNKIILGGPHVTLMHTAAKREKKKGFQDSDRATKDIAELEKRFDVLVCGDGETMIRDALVLNQGIIDGDNRKSVYFLGNKQFSELPLPARHLVDVDSYRYTIEGKKSVSLIAQLGCPFKCTFCSGRNSPFLRNIRQRSSESVVQEMRKLYEDYQFTGFMFYDDELNVNKNLVELLNQISDLQDDVGEEFRLRGFVKAELFTEEQAAAMYRAGFRWLLTGFESGDERILTNIQKRATRADNTRAIEIAKKHNLKVKALMSIGHAGESFESVENTKQWLLETNPEEFDCTIITTYPGSPYFDDAIRKDDHYVYTSEITGDRLYQASIDYLSELDYYKGDPNGGYVSYVWTDHMSPADLVVARDNLEREVREKLSIPFYDARAATKYEHSMGMGNISIPDFILRRSKNG